MLYIYDDAIIDDLNRSLNPNSGINPNVVMATVESFPGIMAQVENDTITYPLILVERDPNTPIITGLMNFTRYQFGVPVTFDNKTNDVYYERALPIDITYLVRVVSTNVADTDELARELFYKYISMYYLKAKLPYEADRTIRFGVSVDMETGIQAESTRSEYISSGVLYQSTIKLHTEGCVSLTYTPKHLKRETLGDIEIK